MQQSRAPQAEAKQHVTQQTQQLLSQLPQPLQQGHLAQFRPAWPKFERPMKLPSQLQEPQSGLGHFGQGMGRRPASADGTFQPPGAAAAVSQDMSSRSVSAELHAIQQQLLQKMKGARNLQVACGATPIYFVMQKHAPQVFNFNGYEHVGLK